HRIWCRYHISSRNRFDPECRAGASGGHGDGRYEFFSCPCEHVGGGHHGYDSSGCPGCHARAGHRHGSPGGNRKSRAGIDIAIVFRLVFFAADLFLVAALAAVLLMEERPLRGPATRPAPVSAETPAAPAE